MISLLESTIRHYFILFYFFCFKVETIAVFGGGAAKKQQYWSEKNNAIFSKYSSPDKSCQGQTYARLLNRKHYLCTTLFAWRALLKEQNCSGTAVLVAEVQ